MQVQDRIERELFIPASQDRVWAALTTRDGLAGWFCSDAQIDLRPGGLIHFFWQTIPDCQGIVVTVDPMSRFSYRWHPGSEQDSSIPIAEQSLTLVEFTLAPVDGGTRLSLVESGFAALPSAIYARVWGENTQGWDEELVNLSSFCARTAAV